MRSEPLAARGILLTVSKVHRESIVEENYDTFLLAWSGS